MRTYRYLHLDVFTDRPLMGNQLAVFPHAENLEPAMMQSIALEMAFSETTFVLPPETSDTNARVRIFTPRAEIPMAGHPTIGTTFALAHEGRIAAEQPSITLGLGIGPTLVRLEWKAGRLRFAWMTQPIPEFGAIAANTGDLATALGLEDSDIRKTRLPVQVASSGVPFLYVPISSRDAVNRAEFERGAFLRFCRAAVLNELPVFVFSLESTGDGATAFSRMFAPGFGVPEDPATGGASGPLGAYLVHHGAVSIEQAAHMVSLQGVRMGRPSEIHISIAAHDRQITDVRVGGQAVLVAEGTLQL
jgi:trans-2,3-dihydro-3-hydroxyanthranilate isomerase